MTSSDEEKTGLCCRTCTGTVDIYPDVIHSVTKLQRNHWISLGSIFADCQFLKSLLRIYSLNLPVHTWHNITRSVVLNCSVCLVMDKGYLWNPRKLNRLTFYDKSKVFILWKSVKMVWCFIYTSEGLWWVLLVLSFCKYHSCFVIYLC